MGLFDTQTPWKTLTHHKSICYRFCWRKHIIPIWPYLWNIVGAFKMFSCRQRGRWNRRRSTSSTCQASLRACTASSRCPGITINFGLKNASWSCWLPGKILNVLMVRECKRKRWDRERKCTSPENCPLYMKTSALRSSSLIPILKLMLTFLMILLNLSLDTDSSCRIWRQQWNHCRPNYLLEGGTISSCYIHVFVFTTLSVIILTIPDICHFLYTGKIFGE